jgi:hypothetical protein
MGFNPYRKYRAKPADYALIAAVVIAACAMLAWALFA